MKETYCCNCKYWACTKRSRDKKEWPDIRAMCRNKASDLYMRFTLVGVCCKEWTEY